MFVISIIVPDYWNKFKEIDLIDIDYKTDSYIKEGFTTTEDYCREKINKSVGTIIEMKYLHIIVQFALYKFLGYFLYY